MPKPNRSAPPWPAHEADPGEEHVSADKVSPWWGWLGGLVSIGLIAAILMQLNGATSDVLKMVARLPLGVWPTLLLLYLVQPICDFAIFRRLWSLPFAGFAAILRKNVINEVVFGYSGEAYLYVWARRTAGAAIAPFRAIKDANIVSALMGNLATLILVAISATRLRDLDLARHLGPALWSGLIPLVISIGLLFFGRQVFSLRLRELTFVTGVHAVRLVTVSALTILIWRLSLPEVAPGVWVVLLAVRFLVSRIPFLTNKDFVFGNLMLLLLGVHSPIAVLLATLALATLALHLSVIVVLGLFDLWRAVSSAPANIPLHANAGEAHD